MPKQPLLAACVLALVATAGAAHAQDHTYSTADVETGVRLYGAQCALCHGPNGEMVAGVDLRRGRFRRAVTDDDLRDVLAKGAPGGMPPFTFSAAEATGLVAFIRAGFDPAGTAVKVGNVDRGREVFASKGACLACHRVQNEGKRIAPELSDIGALRTPSALQRSLLDPSLAMLPINRPVRIVTTDGRSISGRRLNEDTFSVQLVDDSERLVTVVKRDIKSFEALKTSTMPSVEGRLTPDEVADLVAYLLSLRGLP